MSMSMNTTQTRRFRTLFGSLARKQAHAPVTEWRDIIKIEPRMEALYEECMAACRRYDRGDKTYDGELWYKHFKGRFQKLVGWCAENPLLRHSETHDAAMRKFLPYLP